MNLKNCYERMGGDYDSLISRLGSEKIACKFIFKFAEDKNYSELIRTMETGDYETAFRAAHTLKGICLNLSLTGLAKSSGDLTEALRNNDIQSAKLLLPELTKDYCQTVALIEEYRNSL